MKQCTTHHHACDCREAATRELVNDLMELALEWRSRECSFTDPSGRYVELKTKAQELAYVKGKT